MHSKIVRPGRVTLRILAPIETAPLTLKDRGRLTEQLHELIGSQLSK